MSAATVVVFGATSDSGVEFCRRLRQDGRRVVAVIRASSDPSKLEPLGVEFREADALDRDQVFGVMREFGDQPSVVSLLGGLPTKKDSVVDSSGNINVIDAAAAVNAAHFVLVTSVGCNESWDALVLVPRFILRHTVKEKNKAELHLRESALPWTIIRPGRLTWLRHKPTGRGILIEHPLAAGPITRVDLGELVYRALESDVAIGRTYTAADQRHAKIIGGVEVVPAEV